MSGKHAWAHSTGGRGQGEFRAGLRSGPDPLPEEEQVLGGLSSLSPRPPDLPTAGASHGVFWEVAPPYTRGFRCRRTGPLGPPHPRCGQSGARTSQPAVPTGRLRP